MDNHHDCGPKILVVDDNSRNLEFMMEVLSSVGYTVQTAISGERALKRLQTSLPALVLLDIQMHGIDGFETCQQIKANAKTANIPIIFITAFSDTETIDKSFSLGAVDYISKPVCVNELLARVRTHLQLSSLTQNLEQKVLDRTAELKTLETRQRKLFETSPIGLALCRMDGSLVDVNAAYAAIIGRTIPETLQLTYWDITPDKYAEAEQSQLASLEKTGQYGPYEKEYIHKNGHLVPVRLSGILIEQDGETLMWSSVEDISDRKQAEQLLTAYNHELEQQVEERTRELQQSQYELTDYIENAATSLHWVDADGTIVWANQTELDFLGYSREEYIGQPIAKFHEDADVIADILTRLSNNETLVNYEARLRCNDGSVRYVQINSNAFYRDGKFIHTRCFTTDITERKAAETALNDLVAGTAALTGPDFFPALVQHIAIALQASHAFVTEVVEGGDRLQSLAAWADGEYLPNDTVDIQGTTCERVLAQGVYHCKRDVIKHFPQNSKLAPMEVDSYMGVALKNRNGQSIGTLGISSREAIVDPEHAKQILQVFAARASAELERLYAQRALEELNKELEQRVETRTQELARSEQDLRTIFNNVYDAIFIHDLNGDILDINEQAVELLGVPREKILVANIADISSPDAPLDKIPALLQRSWAGLRFEWQDRRLSDGSTFDVEISLQKVRLGNRPVIVAGVRDISDRKTAERSLRQRENQFRNLVSNIDGVVYRCANDDKWSIVFISDAIENLTGYAAADFIDSQRTFASIMHPDDIEAVAASVDDALKRQESFSLEYRIIDRNGNSRWVYEQGKGIFDEDDQCLFLEGVTVDISERKQLEQEQAWLTAILEATPDFIGVANIQGEILWHNHAFRQIRPELGNPEDRIHLSVCHPQETNDYLRTHALPTAMEKGIWSGETIVIDQNGQEIPVSQVILAHKSADGTIERLSTIMRDIRDRKQAETALKLSEARAQATFTQARVGFAEVDLMTKKCVRVNDCFCQMLGYSQSELTALTVKDITYQDDIPTSIKVLRKLHGGKVDSINIEKRYVRKDGTIFWADTTCYMIQPEGGEAVYSVALIQDISEKKRLENERQQAKNAFQEEQSRLKLALDAAQMGTWSYGLQTGKVIHSKRTQEIFGLKPSAFPEERKTFASMVHPDDYERVMAAIDTTIETGIPCQLEYRIQRSDGEMRWIAAWGQVFYPIDSEEPQLAGVIADISDRKAAEEKLRASEQRLRRAIEDAPFPIMIHAEDGEVLQISSTWTELTGYTHADIPTVTAWAEQAYGEEVAKLFQRLMAHKYALTTRWEEGEFTVQTKSGQKRLWQFSSAPLGPLPDGRRSVISMAVDITMQRQVERHLGRANQKLEEYSHTLEQKVDERTKALEIAKAQVEKANEYEQALNHIVTSIRQSLDITNIFSSTTQEVRAVLECDRVVVYQFAPDWSGKFIFESAIFGLPRLAVLDHQTEWQDSFLQERQGGKYQFNQISVVDDIYQSPHSPCHLEVLERFQIKSYLIIPIFVRKRLWGLLAAYHHSQPRIWQAEEIQLFRQVTLHMGVALQQTELLKEMTLAKENADAANQAKDIFLANMSHELRTPLNGILGYAQILERSPDLSRRDYEGLKTIHQCGNHLLHLINDILDFSKIEAHKLELTNTTVNLPNLLASVLNMCQVQADQKGIALAYHPDSRLANNVLVDETRLRQVLINLLSNAIKFTDKGSVTLEVEPATATIHQNQDNTDGRGICLSFRIIDTGVGIAASDFKKLFMAFEQVGDRQQQTVGTGLGLAISQRIVQKMGGLIEVQSTLGQGSTFSFNLRLEEPSPHTVAPITQEQTLMPCGYRGDRRAILVVDNNKANRDVIYHFLAPLGFTILEAEDGKAGLEKYLAAMPDLIIADLTMPVMDGYEMIGKIRKHESPKVPHIIASSASVEPKVQQKAINAGAEGFLLKPIQATHLLQQIAEQLNISWLMSKDRHSCPNKVQQIAPSDTALCSVYPHTETLNTMLELTQRGRVKNLCDRLEALMEEDENYAPFAQSLLNLGRQFKLSDIEAMLFQYLA